MDLIPGNLSRMMFHRFAYHCLCLGDRRGDKDEIIVAAALEAVAHTYTTCFSESCYHVVYGVHMDLLSHAPLG